jgi:hypothetical protein
VDEYYAEHGERDLAAFITILSNWRLSYEKLDDRTLLVPAEGPHSLLLTTIQVAGKQTTLDTLFPFKAPAERRSRAIELAARLNWRLSAGALTPNPDDGDLGFRTCLTIRAEHITVSLAAEALKQHWAAANRVVSGLAVVVFTDLSLAVAIEQNEGTSPIAEVIQDAVRRLDLDSD